MDSFTRTMQTLAEKLKGVGAIFLMGMALLTCADIIGRLFKHPIFGSIELVSFMGVLAIATSLPFTHSHKGHIGVELFVRKLPRRVRGYIELVTEVAGLLLFVLITYKMFEYGHKVQQSGELSMNLQLPEYMIMYALGCGFVLFSLIIVCSIIKTINKLRKS